MTNSPSLLGWRVLVTRPAEQNASLLQALADAGAMPVAFPTIALGPPPSWDAFDAAAAQIASYSWMVFSSPSAVRFTFDHAPALAERLREPGAPAVAAVGNETAKALGERQVAVSIVPEDQRQEGLAAAFRGLPRGTRLLFPQALGGRELLRDELARAGAVVDVVPVSQTVAVPLAAPPPFEAAIFASPSALKAFVAGLGQAALVGKVVAVIGPTTRKAADELGVAVDVVAPVPSVAALVGALSDFRRPT